MAANLRTKPIDRRRLSAQDKATYKPGPRSQALSKAKSYVNAQNRQLTRPERTTKKTPGTGGFTRGIAIQQQRMIDKGAELKRAKSLRPEAAVNPNIYKQLST